MTVHSVRRRKVGTSRLVIVICALLCSLNSVVGDIGGYVHVPEVAVRGGRTNLKSVRISPTSIVGNAKNAAEVAHKGHKMSLSTLIINIVADLCPHGMLPLAYGIAQGGPTGLVPAISLVAVFGFMSAYTMTLYAKMAQETKSNSISELWAKLLSEKSRWMADVAVFSLCFGCCVFYSAFVGDIFGALSQAAGVTGLFSKRSTVLAVISAVCLLPLCLLEDISSLQFSSVLGVVGIMFTVLFHVKRVSDGTYTPKSGLFAKLLSSKMQPKWPSPKFTLYTVNKGTLILVNMLCVAFLAHYNAINYYKELDGATEQRYKVAITAGFGTALTVFIGKTLPKPVPHTNFMLIVRIKLSL